MGLQKNVASQRWYVYAYDRTDDTPKTGDAANISASLSKDGGAAASTNDANPTELSSGYYVFELTQEETNAEVLCLIPITPTADIQVRSLPEALYTDNLIAMAGGQFNQTVDSLRASRIRGDAEWITAKFTTALTEAYPADGADATLAELLYLILQNVSEFAIAGTTKTVKKLDGSATAATYTLDDATAPTSTTRAT